MEWLTSVERDGQRYFCFIDVCTTLFPGVSKSTVRSWLKVLKFPCISCTQAERSIFKGNNPLLSGSFGLVSQEGVSALLTYRGGKSSRPFPNTSASHTLTNPEEKQIEHEPTCSLPACPARIAERSIFKGNNLFSEEGVTALLTYTGGKSSSPFPTTDPASQTLKNPEEKEIEHEPTCSFPASPARIVEYESSLSEDESASLPTASGKRRPSEREPFPSRKRLFVRVPSHTRAASERGNSSEILTTAHSGEPDKSEHSASEQVENETVSSPRRRRDPYKLPLQEITPALKEEIAGLHKFYTSSIQMQREGNAFSNSTITKLIERVLCFMFYFKNFKKIEPLSLNIFNNEQVVSDYILHLKDVRKLMPSTIVSILTVAINVVKYNYRGDPIMQRNCRQLASYRRVQRQLSKQARVFSQRAKEGMTKKSSQQFYFSLILETLRSLQGKFLESRGIEKARHLHDFALIALYLRAMPGRSNDIRLLKLFIASNTKPFEEWEHSSDNLIVFTEDNRVFVIQNNHKTVQSHGPSRIDITDDSELVKYLKMYLDMRDRLLRGNSHDSFFVSTLGLPFLSSSAVSNYLGNLFEREVSMRAGTNQLRHAIVTYFMSIDESKDVSVRESLASLMKHSVRYQASVYDDNTHDTKTMKGRKLLRKKLSSDIFADHDESSETSSNDSVSDGEEERIKPKLNDICALLDPVSTAENIHFFLAKVARYTPDGKEAHLIHLELLQGSENLYRIKPGKVWRESTSALIFPIDIVYNPSESAYELRTSAEDIYQYVHEM